VEDAYKILEDAYGGRQAQQMLEGLDKSEEHYLKLHGMTEGHSKALEALAAQKRYASSGSQADHDLLQTLTSEVGLDMRAMEDMTDAQVISAFKGQGGMEYAILKPKVKDGKEVQPNKFRLYSSPVAGVGIAYMAVRQGIDPTPQLKEEGYDDEEITAIMKDVEGIQKAVEDGFTFEDAMNHLKTKEPQIENVEAVEDPSWLEEQFDKVKGAWEENRRQTKEFSAQLALMQGKDNDQELFNNLKIIQPNMSSIMTRIKDVGGNKEAFTRARLLEKQSAQRIVDLAKERGLNLVFEPDQNPDALDKMAGAGQFYVIKDDGTKEPLSTTAMQDLAREKYEILGGVSMGVLGAKHGVEATSRVTKNPYALAAGGFAGSMLYATGGAVAGTEADYLLASATLVEEMSAKIAARKALTAAEAGVLGDTLGWGVAKTGKTALEAFVRVKDLVLDGNTKGAKETLQKQLFLDDSEVDQIINSLREVTDTASEKATDLKNRIINYFDPSTGPVKDFDGNIVESAKQTQRSKLSKDEEILRGLVLTQPGGETVLKAAAAKDPQANMSVAKSIDNRAQDLLKATANLTDKDIGRVLKDDLDNYVASTKKFYGDVKGQLETSPKLDSVKFDYDKLAVEPILARMEKGIKDNETLERFRRHVEVIKGMSDSRTMADLVELRQIVNDFKFNKRITKANDQKALTEVINNIDASLEQGVQVIMENPKQWLDDFQTAKTEYAKMLNLKKNVIARTLGRKGLSNEAVTKALVKYVNDIDGNFQEIMSKLPITARKQAEGSVVDALANKYTIGSEGGMKVVNFPALAGDLETISFTTPEARKMKGAITKLSEVFKNDIPLANATGAMQVPRFQSYLTADPVVRMKFGLASSIFNRVSQLAPTQSSKNTALVLRTAELLESPLNAKLMKELMEEVGDDVVLTKQLVELQQEAARQAMDNKQNPAVGRFYVKGDLLSTKGSGPVESIQLDRVATYAKRREVAERYGIDINDKKKLDEYLAREGYVATQQGSETIRRLK